MHVEPELMVGSPLEPLPYHRAVADWLAQEGPGLWSWHEQTATSPHRTEAITLDLLKSTYRLDRAAHEDLYELVDAAAAALGVTVPVTLYQAQGPGDRLNASLLFLPEAAHLVFLGPVLAQLDPAGITAIIGHELGHHRLWTLHGGSFGTADRLLDHALEHPPVPASVAVTAQRWSLATEVFADRASLIATGDLDTVIATLVRIETGSPVVHARAYLAQAEEVLTKGVDRSAGISHPECFIRAVALATWARRDPDAAERIERLLNGPLDPRSLDLPGQARCTALTRAVLERTLTPTWMRSEAVLAHAHQFFLDLDPGADHPELDAQILAGGAPLQDYVGWLLLDCVAADRALGDLAIAHGLSLARRWGFADRFAEVLQKEVKLKAKDVTRIRSQTAELLAAAEAQQVRDDG